MAEPLPDIFNDPSYWGKGVTTRRDTPAPAAASPATPAGGGNAEPLPDLFNNPQYWTQGAAPSARPTAPNIAVQGPPDFTTVYKASVVDDPATKFRLYASKRFPTLNAVEAAKRYFADEATGAVYYVDNDGIPRPEIPEGENGAPWLANLAAHAPETLLGTVGTAIRGPAGAALGSAAGALARKAQGALVLGEPWNTTQAGAEAGIAAGVGLLGSGGTMAAETGLRAGINKGLRSGAGDVGDFIARDARVFNQGNYPGMEALEQKAASAGIGLTPGEAANSPTMLNRHKTIAASPGPGGEKIRAWETDVRAPELQRALNDQLDAISPQGNMFDAAQKGVQTAKGVLDGLEAKATAASSPVYQRAFAEARPVDTSPVMEAVERLATTVPEKGQTNKALERVRRLLTRSDVDPVTGEATMVPETRIEVLDNAKKEIDVMLEGPDSASLHKDIIRRLAMVKNRLVDAMDAASPLYREARRTYAVERGKFDEATMTLLGRLSKLEGENVSRAPNILFSGQYSPEAIGRAKALIAGADPEAWNGLVRAHLQGVLHGIRQVSADVGLGSNFRGKVFGTVADRDAMRAALTPRQYRSFSDFMDVLEATGRTVDRNSNTQAKLAQERAMKVEAQHSDAIGRVLGLTKLLKVSSWRDMWEERQLLRYQSAIADALLSPQGAAVLRRIKQLRPGSTGQVAAFGTFLGEIGYWTYGDKPEAGGAPWPVGKPQPPTLGDMQKPGGAVTPLKPLSSKAPEELRTLTENTAAKYGVDPALVHNVITAESAWNPGAVSPVGARGLMQLMPGTAKELGVNPDDAAENIEGGVKYLARLLNRYAGDERLALMAYNWGMGNVDKYLAGNKAIPQETLSYVAKVLGTEPPKVRRA